ncbi:MAG: serine/threonine-protein kinase [Polyangiaceae bacterium]
MHENDENSGGRLPAAGERIAGKYVVDRVLKRGGMGVVLAARHAELGQPVAIKVLLPELAGDAAMVARFLREGRAVSALRSDHVVRVHDVGRLDGGTPYLVMEMLHGSDLDRRVRKQGPLPWQEAVGYVMEVCEALVEAHALGIVHRDLKPSNLFLVNLPSGNTTVKVLDFGISKTNGLDAPLNDGHGLTTTEAVLGSPTFMAPEQLKSAKYVDARADIWSLGLVLYFLVTGKLAFDADTLGAYLVKILQENPIPVRSWRPDLPEELAQVIQRAIEKDPDRRFQNAAEMRAALAPFAPFAAHTSGLYAAARVSGAFAAAAVPQITGLSPSAPTPAGAFGASGPTPAGPFGASVSTPVGGIGSALLTPAYGLPGPAIMPSDRAPMSASGNHPASAGAMPPPPAAGSSDAPSVPPGLGSPTTQASWTSVGRRAPSNLRWAVIAFGIAVTGLITVALWPAGPPQGEHAANGSAVTAATTSAAATTAIAPSTSADVTPSASASASASATASSTAALSASATPSTSAPTKSGPAPTGTARTKTPGTKRVSGPMETDL